MSTADLSGCLCRGGFESSTNSVSPGIVVCFWTLAMQTANGLGAECGNLAGPETTRGSNIGGAWILKRDQTEVPI